jgi:ER-bound oxygenase mpaB/B'/Rubber oxygenase, catalytic domain
MSVQSCPFHVTQIGAQIPPGPHYRRPWRIFHAPQIRQEISQLDAQTDCQRIVYLLTCYEFPFDITRSLELALFHTFGSRSVSQLLDRTGEFQQRGQQRYDDTSMLIAQFMEAGWDQDLGHRAIERMNTIHARYRIPNDDFLFVLWTFIDFPIVWMASFGWRAFTAHECQAWFHYWIGIGQRMGLRDIPADKASFDRWIQAYEQHEMVFNETNARVAQATVSVMEHWFPPALLRWVKPMVVCMLRPQLRQALGWPHPPAWRVACIHQILKLRARMKSLISIERYPNLLSSRHYRSYPGATMQPEQLGPVSHGQQTGAP